MQSMSHCSTYRTALLLPSITQKLESMLVVKELNANLFDDALSDELLLEALTCPISGVEPDYQRLELLGERCCTSDHSMNNT